MSINPTNLSSIYSSPHFPLFEPGPDYLRRDQGAHYHLPILISSPRSVRPAYTTLFSTGEHLSSSSDDESIGTPQSDWVHNPDIKFHTAIGDRDQDHAYQDRQPSALFKTDSTFQEDRPIKPLPTRRRAHRPLSVGDPRAPTASLNDDDPAPDASPSGFSGRIAALLADLPASIHTAKTDPYADLYFDLDSCPPDFVQFILQSQADGPRLADFQQDLAPPVHATPFSRTPTGDRDTESLPVEAWSGSLVAHAPTVDSRAHEQERRWSPFSRCSFFLDQYWVDIHSVTVTRRGAFAEIETQLLEEIDVFRALVVDLRVERDFHVARVAELVDEESQLRVNPYAKYLDKLQRGDITLERENVENILRTFLVDLRRVGNIPRHRFFGLIQAETYFAATLMAEELPSLEQWEACEIRQLIHDENAQVDAWAMRRLNECMDAWTEDQNTVSQIQMLRKTARVTAVQIASLENECVVQQARVGINPALELQARSQTVLERQKWLRNRGHVIESNRKFPAALKKQGFGTRGARRERRKSRTVKAQMDRILKRMKAIDAEMATLVPPKPPVEVYLQMAFARKESARAKSKTLTHELKKQKALCREWKYIHEDNDYRYELEMRWMDRTEAQFAWMEGRVKELQAQRGRVMLRIKAERGEVIDVDDVGAEEKEPSRVEVLRAQAAELRAMHYVGTDKWGMERVLSSGEEVVDLMDEIAEMKRKIDELENELEED